MVKFPKVKFTFIYSYWQLLLIDILLNENFFTLFTQLKLVGPELFLSSQYTGKFRRFKSNGKGKNKSK